MPTSSKTPQKVDSLRPYEYHGVDLDDYGRGQALGRCPFCGKEGKFSVEVATSKFKCWVCLVEGNALEFIRQLWRVSHETTTAAQYKALADDRKLLLQDTPKHWGAAVSITTRDWVVPGYNAAGNICNLYRRLRDGDRWKLLPTPECEGVYHGLHGMPLYDKGKDPVYLCEGVWDGMAMWETLRITKQPGQVLAVHSCGAVGKPLERVASVFTGKTVDLMFDSDHPLSVGGKQVPHGGFSATKRAYCVLASHTEKINYLYWGPDGYDPKLPDGYDVRDALTAKPDIKNRTHALTTLLSRLRPADPSWIVKESSSSELRPTKCTSWTELEQAWRLAVNFHESMDRALSIELASILSTYTMGDPIWLKIVGSPSCGKTTLAEALAVAQKYVKSVSHLGNSLFSGYKTDKEGAEDHSLIAKIDKKTLVVKDGSTLQKMPGLDKILSQLRDLYDCVTRAHYGNALERNYENVRCTVHINGTDSLRELDDTCLGARFIDVVFSKIDDNLEWAIASRVYDNVMQNAGTLINGRADSRKSKELVRAMKLTGGYIEYLCENAERLIQAVKVPEDLKDKIIRLGLFVEHLRARPPSNQTEIEEGRQLVARLVGQFARLAKHLAAAMSKKEIDAEVWRRVRQTGLDTARGKTFEVCKHLHANRIKGVSVGSLTVHLSSCSGFAGQGEDRVRAYLSFLKKIQVANFEVSKSRRITWKLTAKMAELWKKVVEEK